MTADDIADEIVTVFNAIAAPVFAFTAVNPADGPEVEREDQTTTVQVYGYSESEEPLDRGDVLQSDREINVVLTRTLDSSDTRKDCLDWLNQLKDALKETEFGGYRWRGNETVTLYDLDALVQQRQFLSLFRATYRSFV